MSNLKSPSGKYVRPKKKRAVVTPPGPNTRVTNPQTSNHHFGAVPDCKSGGVAIPGGPIELRHGKHVGPHKGFGVEHIWAEHKADMQKHGLTTKADVPSYVALIVSVGAQIYFEADNMRKTKLTVVRSQYGSAILEMRGEPPNCSWSVVTVFGRKNANGSLVGAVV